MNFKRNLLSSAILSSLLLAPLAVIAEDDVVVGERLTVTGILPDRLEAIPGSFQIIDEDSLQNRRPISNIEKLRLVPGVNVVPDGSMGFDANIGIRGQNPRRAGKIMMMEDGVPLQLAPYVDPVVHYTTPSQVTSRVEVVKGAGQILYGPQTLGGAVNFVTKPVPRNGEIEGSVTSAFGNQDYRLLHGNIGFGNSVGGLMVDFTQNKGDGIFKGAEFDVKDYRIKGELDITERQTVGLKLVHTRDRRNQTENYLSLDEYDRDPFSHPTVDLDKWEQDREVYQLTHRFEVNDNLTVRSQAYYTDTFRNGLRASNSARPGAGGLGFSRLRSCPASGLGMEPRVDQVSDVSICGGRHAPRQFYTMGLESRADFGHSLFGLDNDAIVGIRYHEERAIRKQVFAQDAAERRSYSLALENNAFRHETLKARALSYYGQNTTYLGDWSVTPGFRVESISSSDTNNITGERGTDNETEFLPSFGVAWNGLPNTTVFAGVHQGISPSRANRDSSIQSDTKAEESTLYEVGFRSNYFTGIAFETALFHNRIKNTIIDAGDFFSNGGKSEQTGIELAGRINFGDIYNTSNNFYISGAFTHLAKAKYESTIIQDEDDPTDTIDISGNRMQYAPRNLINLDVGFEHQAGWDARIGVQHVGSQYVDDINTRDEVRDALRPDRRQGIQGIIPSYTIWNASVNYRVPNSGVTLFASVENLFDKEFLVSRNEGKLAGRERLFFGGITYDF